MSQDSLLPVLRGRSTSQSVARLGARCTGQLRRDRCPLATVVRPHVRPVALDSVIEPLEISNQRLERKAVQLSTAELRDARPIRSDTPRDVISVAALELSEHLAQLSLERRDRIDSRRGVLVSHGATLSHATRLVVIKRTHTSRQEREAVSSVGQPVAILPPFDRIARWPEDDTDRVPRGSYRVERLGYSGPLAIRITHSNTRRPRFMK